MMLDISNCLPRLEKDVPGINIHLPVFKSSTNPFERYISGRSGSIRCFLGLGGPESGLMPEASFLSLAQFAKSWVDILLTFLVIQRDLTDCQLCALERGINKRTSEPE